MGHLGGEGYYLIVLIGGGDTDASEAGRAQKLLYLLQQGNIVIAGGYDYHGCATKHVGFAVFKAGVVDSGHGMASDEGKAIALSQPEALGADFPLDTAAVYYICFLGYNRRVFNQKLYGCPGIKGYEYQPAVPDCISIQFTVHNSGDFGDVHNTISGIQGEDFCVTVLLIRSCQGAPD